MTAITDPRGAREQTRPFMRTSAWLLSLWSICPGPSCSSASQGVQPPRTTSAPQAAQGCAACHPVQERDRLSGRHREAGVKCEGCHDPAGFHPAGKPDAARPARAASAAAQAKLDRTCRPCHERSSAASDIERGYLHWRRAAREGLYGRQGQRGCSGCHRHGS